MPTNKDTNEQQALSRNQLIFHLQVDLVEFIFSSVFHGEPFPGEVRIIEVRVRNRFRLLQLDATVL